MYTAILDTLYWRWQRHLWHMHQTFYNYLALVLIQTTEPLSEESCLVMLSVFATMLVDLDSATLRILARTANRKLSANSADLSDFAALLK